mmetsp:Transcript_962/g.1096  ORF Transcript_962/g.1096 Transcript_962/m.1096 type:complete len:88 (+) Transcript_962:36-299(+)
MPKYYCDYCDIWLTHDSPSVRKNHNDGWKHKFCVRSFYSLLVYGDVFPGPMGPPGPGFNGPPRQFNGLPFPGRGRGPPPGNNYPPRY